MEPLEDVTDVPAPPKVLLGVWAHPDDEAYLSAGLMLRTTASGGRVVCVHATRGELGTDDPATWPPERLGPHREVELDRALAAVGVHDHELMGLPDGGCAEVAPEGPVRRIAQVMRELRPDVVVTFGPDGMTGHPDHIAVSRWTTEAWQSVGTGALLYAATTEGFMERNADLHRRFDLAPETASCVPDDRVALQLDLTEDELRTKRASLAAHATQTVGLAELLGEERFTRWFDAEIFRRPTLEELSAGVAALIAGVR
jgi:LmbE family N-acetylglucosaminyl deacetylase